MPIWGRLLHHYVVFNPKELLLNATELHQRPLGLQQEHRTVPVGHVATKMQNSTAKLLDANNVSLLHVKQFEEGPQQARFQTKRLNKLVIFRIAENLDECLV